MHILTLCKLKAAQSAMFLIRRYAVDEQSASALLAWLKPYEDFAYRKIGHWQDLPNCRLNKAMVSKNSNQYSDDLVNKMVLLIKEELHHFYQVLEIMAKYEIAYDHLSSSRYAKGLLQHCKQHEPDALVDKLICGAFIEARSCERFAKLAPHVDKTLADFYVSLLRSEARHFEDYLKLAQSISKTDIQAKIDYFAQVEAELINSNDSELRFHSGVYHPRPSHSVIATEVAIR